MATNRPDGTIITPGGRRRAADHHVVRPGEPLRRTSDRSRAFVAHATRQLMEVATPEQGVIHRPEASGWVAWARWQNDSGTPIASFRTTWLVPPVPAVRATQLVYFFNGLEDRAGSVILQPVLQWGVSPSGGGPGWYAASWYVPRNGPAFSSPLVPVAGGQSLTGVMTLRAVQAGGYSYTSSFDGLPDTTLLVDDTMELRVAFETLEAYNVTQPPEYPANAGTSFTGIALRNATGGLNPQWQPAAQATLGESCAVQGPDVVITY